MKTFTDPRLCAAIVDRLTFNGAITQTGTEFSRGLRKAGDRREVRGFDRPVVTDRLLGTGVVAVFITVCRVVLGDPVDEGRRHVAPREVRRGISR